MKILRSMWLGSLLLVSVPVWPQENPPSIPVPAVSGPVISLSPNDDNDSDRMLTPPPVSGQAYPVSFASEERANYLRGGLGFTTAYTDNAIGSAAGHPVSDVSYSVAPFIALDET